MAGSRLVSSHLTHRYLRTAILLSEQLSADYQLISEQLKKRKHVPSVSGLYRRPKL